MNFASLSGERAINQPGRRSYFDGTIVTAMTYPVRLGSLGIAHENLFDCQNRQRIRGAGGREKYPESRQQAAGRAACHLGRGIAAVASGPAMFVADPSGAF